MFGCRSARGRAILVGVVLTLFLVGVTALTVWRNEDYNRQFDRLERASDTASALEHARAQLYLQTSLLSGLASSHDPSLVEEYRQAQAALEQDLIQARAEATNRGDQAQLAMLDDLTARMVEFEAAANLAIPILLDIDASEAAQMAAAHQPELAANADSVFADLDQLAENGRTDLAAERAAMDREADVNFWLIVARGVAAFVLTAVIATVVLLSILRPLASVRLSARAIAAGNLNARAKVFGPEEVASLARDFNRMTDALAAKTEEYITTTNLTGDIIGKLDVRNRWTFLNDAACQFLGKPRERLLGIDAAVAIHPEDSESTARALQEARASREPRQGLVNRVVTPLGTRVVEWNAHPLFDEEGQYTGTQITGRDITERKRAEEALIQAEQRYRELFEDAPAMYVVCRNQDGAPFIADCNELFVTALGYGRDEVVGRPVADFYTPESRAQLQEGGGFQRALAGQFAAEERQLVTKDGRIVETTLRAVPEIGPDGRVLGTRAMYVDITDRKRAEEALRGSEARYRLLAENTTDLIWTMDLSLRYTYMSPAITRMRGYSVEEIVGTTIQQTMTPASLEVARNALAEELALERAGQADPSRSRKIELEMYCKDGSTIWTEMNTTFLRDSDGRPIGILGVTRDVSKRKQVEEALRESEEKYRRLVQDSTEGIAIVAGLEVKFVNRALLKMYGGESEDEMVGRPLTDLVAPEHRDLMVERSLAREKGQDVPTQYEFKALRKDGTQFDAELSVSLITYEGKVARQGVIRDITERKRAEEALRESEARYRLLAENTSDLIWTMDLNLRYTYMSPAITRMRGYSVEEIVGTTIQETMTPASLEVARKALAEELAIERMEQKDPFRSRKMELEMYCKDGSTIWTEMNTTFLRDSDGRPVGILGVTRDISERKQAEEALRQSVEEFGLVFENAKDAVFWADPETGLIIRCNTAAEGLLERERGEIIGQHQTVLHPPQKAAHYAEMFKTHIEEEGSADDEAEVITKSGRITPVHITASVIPVGGKPTIQGIFRDITERKRAEEALRESEARYRLLTENTADVVWTMDLGLKYTYVSPAIARMRGYTVEEAMGLSASDVMTPASLEATMQMLAEQLALEAVEGTDPNRSAKVELEMYCKDGSTIWTEMNVTFLRDADGRPVGILGVTRDITERKQMEQALAARMEEYVATTNLTGDIIAKIDHEGKWTFLNDAACQFLGKPRKRLLGTDARASVHPEDLEPTVQAILEARERKQPIREFVNRQITPTGTRVVEWNAHPLFDEQGEYVGIQMTGRDISERKQAEEALDESERRYRLLAENASDIIWTMDMNLRYTYESPAVTRIRGYTPEEAMAQTIEETLTPASLEVARKALAEELTPRKMAKDLSRFRTLELEHTCKDGSTVWLEVTTTFLRDEDGRLVGLLGASRDISERKRAEEERKTLHAELEVRAVTDSLTGLHNHAYFYERLADEIDRSKRYGHRFALVMMDIDAFKHYNDSRGHQAGDAALRLVGECIRSAMRRSDLAFRYGGDEFVTILLNADVSKAQDIVRRINRRIATRLKEAGDSAGAWLGVSAGIACYPTDATTVDELVGMADTAMYDAKRLAWARGVMGRGQAVELAGCQVEVPHETQTSMLSGAANSLTAALQDLTAADVVAESDLRTIAALGAAAEIKDPFILGHHERTSRLAATVATEMGLSPDRVRSLTTAGLLHDLGKISVSEGILNKPGKLTESEFAKMKEHPALGASMIVSGAEALQPLAPIVRHHHERVDGSGYPDGLARENIPLEARILSVADAFDAMTHERAYRKALSAEEALGEIQRGAGTRFDSGVVEAFLGVVRRRGGEPG